MKLDEILTKAGHYKQRRRVGRGTGSGQGKTAGRGTKGYYARSGAWRRPGYEGGQTTIIARMPQRGFSNFKFRTDYQVVNVSDLEKKFDADARVDAAALKKVGLITHDDQPVKVLGDGAVTKKLTVVADKFSATASEKIKQAGGSVELLQRPAATKAAQ